MVEVAVWRVLLLLFSFLLLVMGLRFFFSNVGFPGRKAEGEVYHGA
jgi:hypothetical protein